VEVVSEEGAAQEEITNKVSRNNLFRLGTIEEGITVNLVRQIGWNFGV
jgi:hypothetical protein